MKNDIISCVKNIKKSGDKMLHVEQEIFEQEDDILLVNAWEKDFKVTAGFTTRNGGVSPKPWDTANYSFIVGDTKENVLGNRMRLAKKLNTEYDQWIFAEQKHTTNNREVTKADCGAGSESFESGIKNCDALYTKKSDIVLATFHADCTPVYLYDKKTGYIGLIHAGWQGTASGITMEFMKTWKQLGISPKEVEVVIGPSAQFVAYEVGKEVAEQVIALDLEDARDALIQLTPDTFKLDVPYLNYLQLVDAGVPADQITISSYCTISDEDLFHSFRRDGESGRMLAFIKK